MKDSNNIVFYDPASEARRYIDNAKTVLAKNQSFDPETGCYTDPKYIRSAGHYLWHAVLIMLDAVFNVKTKQHLHPDIKEYLQAVAKRDRKLLDLVNAAYITTHITMGYDGNPSKAVCQSGFNLTNDVIDRCATMLPS